MLYDFVTVGGATEDITFSTKAGIVINNPDDVFHPRLLAFDYGQKIKIEESHSYYGGGAANTAVCIARLGLKVAVIVSIGDDSRGEGVVKNLRNNKVKVSLIQTNKDLETGFSFLLEAQGSEHIVFSNRAANAELQIMDRELAVINQSEWVYITSLSNKWKIALDRIYETKSRKAWNPGRVQIKAGYRVLKKYLVKTNVLSLNKEEAIELAHSTGKYNDKDELYLNDSNNLLKIIKSWGVEIVLITSGSKGADVYDGNNFYHQPIIKGKERVNTTGAGDAFGSTFVVGLKIYGGDIQKAMLLAAKNSASIVSHYGAQGGLLTRQEILK